MSGSVFSSFWLRRLALAASALLIGLFGLASLAWAEPKEKGKDQAAAKAPPAKKSPYVRLQRNDKQRPLALQTAVVHYTKACDPTLSVDLIGAIHVGDRSYYDELNRRFTNYQALLYELVASPEKNVPKQGQKSAHPIGLMQHGMKDVLELEHQLDLIDYKKPNFVHADMSPAEFSKAMADRNESIWTMMFRMIGQGIAMQSERTENGSDLQLLMALFDRNRSLALKRAMAEQFESLEGNLDSLDGPDGSAIITDRNKVAMKVLREQLDAGKKKLAVFYGAGHLADMDRRLVEDFGMQRQSVEWITAWNLNDASKTASKVKRPEAAAPSTKRKAAR